MKILFYYCLNYLMQTNNPKFYVKWFLFIQVIDFKILELHTVTFGSRQCLPSRAAGPGAWRRARPGGPGERTIANPSQYSHGRGNSLVLIPSHQSRAYFESPS